MIVRGMLLTLCLAALVLGSIAGCTPPAGDNGGSSGYQAPSDDPALAGNDDEGANPDPAAPNAGEGEEELSKLLSQAPDAGEGEEELRALLNQASPSTTTGLSDIPSFDEEAVPDTTAPLPEIPSTDEQTPPKTTTPETDTPASDG